MKHIDENGITNSTGGIHRNVCEKNGYYFDLLDSGYWMVSKMDTKIGIFSDCKEGLFYFMAKSEPPEPMTKEEENEVFEWLEQFIK